jgi:metal-responsive CopG/Arc/MetJ family transcriptional regulator
MYKPPRYPMSIRFTQETLDRLDKYCKEEDRNRTNAVRRFVRLALDKYESENNGGDA